MKTVGLCLTLAFLGVFLQMAGMRLNEHVEGKNGDRMPVWAFTQGIEMELLFDPYHDVLSRKSIDRWACDIIPIPGIDNEWNIGVSMMSFGDVLIYTGVLVTLIFYFTPFILLLNYLWRRYS